MTEQAAEYEVPPWTLGWRLQRALSWAGLTTEQMADELGVARSTVSRWCNDKGHPTRGYMKLWALRCGVPFTWLTGEEDSSHNPGQLCEQAANASAERPTTREIAALAKPINDLIPLRRPTPHRSVTRGADR